MANPSSQFECTKGTEIGRADQFWLPLSVRPYGKPSVSKIEMNLGLKPRNEFRT